MKRATVNLVEIFRSFQGEGMHVGSPTIFVRFGGCDLRCAWCDSPGTWTPVPDCRIEVEAGSGSFRTVPNDVPLEEVEKSVAALASDRGVAVSLTGGEPLLQPEAAAELASRLSASGRSVHLETHGLAVGALDGIIDHCAVVAMDWKLASDVRHESDPRAGTVADYHSRHEAFLARALEGPAQTFVKVVITPNSRDDEIAEVCTRIAAQDSGTPLVLQPVTPFGRVKEGPRVPDLIRLAGLCDQKLEEVRVIPQTHRSYGAL